MKPAVTVNIMMTEALEEVYNLHLLAVMTDTSLRDPFVLTTDERPIVEAILRMCATRIASAISSSLNVISFAQPQLQLLSVEVPAGLEFPVENQLRMALSFMAVAFIIDPAKGVPGYNEMAEESLDIIRALTGTHPTLSMHYV